MNRLESFLRSVLSTTVDKTGEKSVNKTDKAISKESTDNKLSNTATTQIHAQNAEIKPAKPLPTLPNIPVNGQAAHPRGSVIANEVGVPKLTGNPAKPLPEKPPSIKPYSPEQLAAMENIAAANKKKNELQLKREGLETKIHYSNIKDPNDFKQLSQIKLYEKKAEIELKQASLELLKANQNPNEKQINEYRDNITKLSIEYQKGYISYLLPSIKEKIANLKNLSPEEQKQNLAYIENFKTLVANSNKLEKAYNVRNTSINVLDGQQGPKPENIQKNASPVPLAEKAKPILPDMQRAGRAPLSETPNEPLSQTSSTIGPPPNRPVPEIPTQAPTQLAAKVEDVAAPLVQNIASQKIEAEKTNPAEAPKIDTAAKTPEQKFYTKIYNKMHEVYTTEKTYHNQLTVLNELRGHFDKSTMEKLAKNASKKEHVQKEFVKALDDLLSNAQIMSNFSKDFLKTIENFETQLKAPNLTETEKNEILLKYSEALSGQRIPDDVKEATANYVVAFKTFTSFFPTNPDLKHPLTSAWNSEINAFKAKLTEEKSNNALYGSATFGSPNGPFIFGVQRFPRYTMFSKELADISKKGNIEGNFQKMSAFDSHIKAQASYINEFERLAEARNVQTAIGNMGKTGNLVMKNRTLFFAQKRKAETKTLEKLGLESKKNDIETFQTAQKILTDANKGLAEKIENLKQVVQADPKNEIATTELLTLTKTNIGLDKSLKDLQNSTWGRRVQNTMNSNEGKELEKLKKQINDTKQTLNIHDAAPSQSPEFSVEKAIPAEKQKEIENKLENIQKQITSFSSIINNADKLSGKERRDFINNNLNSLKEVETDILQLEKDFKGPDGTDKTDFDAKFEELKTKAMESIKENRNNLSLKESNFKSFWQNLIFNQSTENTAQLDFLSTYRNYIGKLNIEEKTIPGNTPSEKLFNLFSIQFAKAQPAEQREILKMANQWLTEPKFHSGDIKNENVQKAIDGLIKAAKMENSNVINEWGSALDSAKNTALKATPPVAPKQGTTSFGDVISKIAAGTITEKDKEYKQAVNALATDLSSLTMHHMSQLNTSDFDVHGKFGADLTNHLRFVQDLASEAIIYQASSSDEKTRVKEGTKVLEFFLDVAVQLHNGTDKTPPDISTAGAIFIGLSRNGIDRLTSKENDNLSEKHKKQLDYANKLFDPSGAFKNAAAFIEGKPGVPAMFQTILVPITNAAEINSIDNVSKQLKQDFVETSIILKNKYLEPMSKMKPEKNFLQFNTQNYFNTTHDKYMFDIKQKAEKPTQPMGNDPEELKKYQNDLKIYNEKILNEHGYYLTELAREKFPKIQKK